jgi:L-seryl-tRNA(Ser) seleniumtransferase
MLTIPFQEICKKADSLLKTIRNEIESIADINLADMNSRPGGGSFPQLNLATRCITIQPKNMSVSKLETRMRMSTPAIIGRIEDNKYIIDPRTLQESQDIIISSTLSRILKKK